MVNIRLAAKEDCLNVFHLSNMDYVRDNSFNTEKIIWENHVQWFNKAIQNDSIKFFIIEDTEFIGQVRLNIDDDTALVSISILKEFWHRGIAFHSLQKIMAENKYTYLAQVKKNNISSIKLFERLGFIRQEENPHTDYYDYKKEQTAKEPAHKKTERKK